MSIDLTKGLEIVSFGGVQIRNNGTGTIPNIV